MGKERADYEEKFWQRVDKSGDCWVWTGGKNGKGRYGTYRGKIASRVAWELINGPIPPGFLACHKCDNPPCVNPDHLFLGTTQDNTDDMIAKGRQAKYRPFPATAECELLELVDQEVPLSEIGRRFKITPKRVAGIAIRNNRIPPEPHTEQVRRGRPTKTRN